MDDHAPTPNLGALLQQLERLRARVAELERENEELRRRLEHAERGAMRPAAPFRRPEAKKVPDGRKKRPGRPPGHPGARRAVPAHVDEHVEVPLAGCPRCRGPVAEVRPRVQYIEDLPPTRPHVTRLVTYRGRCTRCGVVRSAHPLQTSTARGAAGVQLGPRALALAAALNKQLGLTLRATCRALRLLAGLRVSPGGLAQAFARVAGRVRGDYDALADRLRRAPAVFADETSWYVGRPGWWLWAFTAPGTTLYRVEDGRGSGVVRATLGDDFPGVLVSDCLSSYDPVPYRKHKCLAHHLRAIARAGRHPGGATPDYLRQWRTFFGAVIGLWRARGSIGPPRWAELVAAMAAWRDRLLEAPAPLPGDEAVRKRLAKQRDHLLGCLSDPAAEPTNNRAERALRPAVIARKLSCGNKTERGRDSFQVLASLAATCAQRGEDFVAYLAGRLPLTAQAPG
jgi:hypothetical protein